MRGPHSAHASSSWSITRTRAIGASMSRQPLQTSKLPLELTSAQMAATVAASAIKKLRSVASNCSRLLKPIADSNNLRRSRVRESRIFGSVRAKAEWLRDSTIAKKSTPGTLPATGSKVVAIKMELGWIRLRRHFAHENFLKM
jgi:hypothetical protein